MSDEKKNDSGPTDEPEWVHGQELNMESVKKSLLVLKTGLEQAVVECEGLVTRKKAELVRMRGGR